ncbi:MAG: DegT/DnrJ/EryC1/StrS family aminotransferase [Bacteroidales bacterium]|nr:DegT/DnrJ/EryC1/StrS family aminotransferase [Bacteroidales bacterium]
MKIPFVDLQTQYSNIKNEIDETIFGVIDQTAFIGGNYVKKFEEAFSNYIGVKSCIGVGNGTDSIYIALRALGLGPGDEVITVANTFIATSEAITMTGARPVFVDCDENTYNIDVNKIQEAITSKTKAIVPVHLYGQPADMISILEIAKKNNIYIVEDAAQAHGAEISGRRVGTFGDAACFSFYPGKNLGAYGDAGAIVTNNDDLAEKCRMIANHGRIKKYDHDFEGINSRLDGLQAAILDVKLKYLEGWLENRRRVADLYNDLLKGSSVVLPYVPEVMRHVYHLYVIRVKNREKIQSELKEAGIATGIHYPIALPNLQAYKYLGKSQADFPIASRYSNEILSLPMFPELTGEQVEHVCNQLKIALQS